MSNGNGHRWSKWWWGDHRSDPALRMCCLAARGLWIEMQGLMFEAAGYLLVNGRQPSTRQLAALAGATEKEVGLLLAELEEAGVFSRTEDGTIYSRRMVRDALASEQGKLGAKNGGNPQIIRGTVPKDERQRRFRRSDAPMKAQRIFEKAGGRCHWCDKPLQQDHAGHDFFQVDHIVAIRDGGGNEDENLVAACAQCNHDRARHNPTPTSDPNPTLNPKLGSEVIRPQFRPQSPEAKKLEAEEEGESCEDRTEKKPREARRALTTIPPEWEPNAQSKAKAVNLGLNPGEIDLTADQMRAWAKAGDQRKADWDAMFDRFVLQEFSQRAAERRRTNPPSVSAEIRSAVGTLLTIELDDDEDLPTSRKALQ